MPFFFFYVFLHPLNIEVKMNILKGFYKKTTASRLMSQGAALVDVVLFVVLFLLLCGLLALLTEPLSAAMSGTVLMQFMGAEIFSEVLMLVSVLLAAGLVFRLRHIPFAVWGLACRPVEWAKGLLFAVLLYVVGFGASLLSGAVQIASVFFSFPSLLLSLCFFVLVGITEELMMRGVVMGRMLQGGIPGWVALFLSSFLFSLMHLFNPDFSFLPFFNIFLAGILLGIPYLYSRNLSFSIALHCFWNWIQGPVLGYSVSGTQLSGNLSGDTLLTLQQTGSPLLSGGSFGFEGSLICTLLLIIASIVLWRMKKMENGKLKVEN